MADHFGIYEDMGNILLPYAALLCEAVEGTRIMITAVVPEGVNLDSSRLSGKAFFSFHGGQIVSHEDGVEPVSAMTFYHETTGTQLTILMTYAPYIKDTTRFSIAFQLKKKLEAGKLDEALKKMLKDHHFETIYVENQPSALSPESKQSLEAYAVALENYRTTLAGRTLKLYFRQTGAHLAAANTEELVVN